MATTTFGSISSSRLTALKVLYVYTLVGAGVFGMWQLVAPASFASAFGLPEPDVYTIGIVGAVYASFALAAAFGLRDPTAVAPVFYLQLAYKTLWLLLVFAPRAIQGTAPVYAWIFAVVFVTYVVLDLIALPLTRAG